jgi:hypothetical protein
VINIPPLDSRFKVTSRPGRVRGASPETKTPGAGSFTPSPPDPLATSGLPPDTRYSPPAVTPLNSLPP